MKQKVVCGDAMIPEHAHSLSQVGIVRCNDTAFASCEMLDWVQAEGIEIGQRSNVAPHVGTANCVAGISNQHEFMLVSDMA